jgi:catalase-peroxidase
MAMNDEETVALIVGGHTVGKAHGAVARRIGPDPEGAELEAAGPRLGQNFGTAMAQRLPGSGIEVAWTQTPTQVETTSSENLFKYDWVQPRSPGRRVAVGAAKDAEADKVPDATTRRRSTSRPC